MIKLWIPPGKVLGDANMDGIVSTADRLAVLKYLSDPSSTSIDMHAADMNGDGVVDSSDADLIRAAYQNHTPLGELGDVTGNWTTNPSYATAEAQFYADVVIPGFGASDGAVLHLPHWDTKITSISRVSSGIRVYVSACPVDGFPIFAELNDSGQITQLTTLYLITDRTTADVIRCESLTALGLSGMTSEERAEWLAGMPGSYNASDLNRVGNAVAYLADVLTSRGYAVSVNPKTNWRILDNPTPDQLTSYLTDIRAIRAALAVLPTTPAAPTDIEDLTVEEANAIEQILLDIGTLLDNMAASWFYSGDLYSGEV